MVKLYRKETARVINFGIAGPSKEEFILVEEEVANKFISEDPNLWSLTPFNEDLSNE